MLESLDVGCGCRPHGSVNCDLIIKRTPHRSYLDIIDVKSVPNFVLCDAQYLIYALGGGERPQGNIPIHLRRCRF